MQDFNFLGYVNVVWVDAFVEELRVYWVNKLLIVRESGDEIYIFSLDCDIVLCDVRIPITHLNILVF